MATNILETIDLNHLGELLQQARKKCGMTQADAASVIDAVRTTIVAIEKGERRLKPTELIKLARAYGKTVSDFVQPRPVIEPFEVQFRSAIYDRSEAEQGQIDPSISRLEELCQHYLQLEKIVDAPLPRNYPQEYDVANMPIEAAAESIAIAERQRLGLGDGPIPLLRDLLEQGVGLRIFYLKMSKYSGIYSYNELLGGCIAINANHPEERRRWSLAHEYLHFLAHRRKPVVDFDGQYQRKPESERLADTFPGYFLMPTSGLLARFNDMYRTHGKFTPTNLFTLAHYYGVSIEALVNRLESLKLLPSGTWDRLRDRGLKVRQVQKELGLQGTSQRTDMTPIHYQHLAIEALDRGLITEGRFATFLGVDRLEARQIAESLREESVGTIEDSTQLDLLQV
ncbi:MAG: ImmA/IrrE family metallo-endopeptidase [Acaryochloridaceae cyanobacterium RU_4_10]|nr:ImmA/IrrE family metallo-endopeptidase [Acaryochloridaceae cyanobacterium RU_4_10]